MLFHNAYSMQKQKRLSLEYPPETGDMDQNNRYGSQISN